MKKLLLSMFCALGLLSANASVTQIFTQGIGLPDAKAQMPSTPTAYKATDTNIQYTLLYAYTNSGYLMLNGKDNAGAFVSFALDFDCSSIDILTTSNCSTNANNKVNFYANDKLVQEGVAVNVTNATVNIAVPAEYQKAGTVYKFQYDKPASGNSYNSQFASLTYYGVGETPGEPVDPNPGPDPVDPNPGGDGNSVTFDFLNDTYGLPNDNNTYVTDGTVINSGLVNIELNGTGSNCWRLWSDGLRAMNKQNPYFIVSIEGGGKVTGVTISSNKGATFKVDGTDDNVTSWTGSAESVKFVYTASGNNATQTITVTYEGGEAPAVASPVITCENNMVSITCASEGSKIYYTTDGNAPTSASTPYTAPFAITANTTVKAIAYVGTDASAVTTFNAVYVGSYAGFEELVAGGNGTEGTVNGPITAVYQNGSYLYVVDSSNYPMLVYGSLSNTTLANGDLIANITGKYSPFNGLPELTNPVLGNITAGGTPVQPEVITAEELAPDMVNAYVQFENMTLAEDDTNKLMKDETGSVALYSRFTGVTIPTDYTKSYTVTGFVAIYNTTLQVYPVSFVADGENPGGGEDPTPGPGGDDNDQYQTLLNVNDATEIDGTFVEETLKADGSVQAAAHYQPLNSLMIGQFKFEFETTSDSDSQQPAYYYATSTSSNQQKTVRVYNGTSMTITAPAGVNITKVEFTGSNLGSNAAFTVNTGSWSFTGNNATWTGHANNFTVTANASWRFSEANVTTDLALGVESIANADEFAPVEYYNLQGVRVANPVAGQLLIMKQGKNVTKTVIR